MVTLELSLGRTSARLGRRLAAIRARVLLGVVGLFGIVGVWWLAAWIINDAVLLPTPALIFTTLRYYFTHPFPALGNTLPVNIAVSLERILIGFGIGSAIGIILGSAMSYITPLRSMVDPLVELSRPVPPLAYIPLLIVWFGIGEVPKIVLIAIGVTPIMVISVVEALQNVPREYSEVALTLGASRRWAVIHVKLRAAAPYVITGLRLSMGISWTSIVAAEMIAATSGIGYVIIQASNYLVTALVFAGIICIAITALAVDGLLRLVQHWLLPSGRTPEPEGGGL